MILAQGRLQYIKIFINLESPRTYRRFIKAYYNPEQNIWKKVKDASKFGHDQKTLLSSFA